MKKLMIALMAGALFLGTGALSLADHHDKGQSQDGQGHGEAGMPPMGAPAEMKQLEALNGKYTVKFFYKMDPMSEEWTDTTGDFKDGKIVVTGKDMGQGMTFHSRLTTYNMTEKGFDWKYEMSTDGTNYVEGAKATYTRQ